MVIEGRPSQERKALWIKGSHKGLRGGRGGGGNLRGENSHSWGKNEIGWKSALTMNGANPSGKGEGGNGFSNGLQVEMQARSPLYTSDVWKKRKTHSERRTSE